MKMTKNLDEMIEEIIQKGQYHYKEDWEKNWLYSNLMLSELMNPNNAYEYKNYKNEMWYFVDSTDYIFGAIMIAHPAKIPFFEFKTWWQEKGSRKRNYDHLPPSTSRDWDRRSDTIAKIFRDETIPKFAKETYSDLLVIKPVDSQRYQFSLRLCKKFVPNDWEIKENFPKEIIIKRK